MENLNSNLSDVFSPFASSQMHWPSLIKSVYFNLILYRKTYRKIFASLKDYAALFPSIDIGYWNCLNDKKVMKTIHCVAMCYILLSDVTQHHFKAVCLYPGYTLDDFNLILSWILVLFPRNSRSERLRVRTIMQATASFCAIAKCCAFVGCMDL